MDSLMYGSVHTHFESDKDAVNAHFNEKGKISFESSLDEFYKLGAKKIAVTEHGSFASFEDIYAASKKFDGLDIIPGVEVYFDYKGTNNPDTRAHLILIAKDREGYLSLCKIITESNHNIQQGRTKDYPVVTFENLEKNIAKGHIICTSACIAGPLCKTLMSDLCFLKDSISKDEDKLKATEYFTIKKDIDEFKELDSKIKEGLPTKEQLADMKKRGAVEERRQANVLLSDANEKMKSGEYLELKSKAEAGEKYIKANKLTRLINSYNSKLKTLDELTESFSQGKNIETAKNIYERLHSLFGKDFYFEIQNHHLLAEKETYNALVRFAISVGNPQFIASNDIHICMRKDTFKFQDEITKRKVAKFMALHTMALHTYEEDTIDEYEYGIKTDSELRDELLELIEPFKDFTAEQIADSAIENIKTALSECKPFEPIYEDHYPKFCDNDIAEFERLVNAGLKDKFPNGFPKEKESEYKERLKKEMHIIESMGYASYHLIVQDYLNYGRLLGYLPESEVDNAPLSIDELNNLITQKGYKRRGYSIGPGRGSAAGSLVCYLLGITDVDPIPYNLLFERFLNPERKSMPDIDSDFRTDIREKCVMYCAKKYGESKVCRIMTKTYNSSKGAVRLAARFLGAKEAKETESAEPKSDDKSDTLTAKWYKIGDSVCKIIDKKEKEKFTNQNKEQTDNNMESDEESADEEEIIYDGSLESLLKEPDLTKEQVDCIQIARAINGIFNTYGEHAAGVIISKDDISDVIPLMYNSKADNFSTQCTMAQAEAKGLLKMDFLGLKNLNIITNVLKETDDEKLQDYSLRDKILNDPKIYADIYCSGKTLGIFQFESPGMTNMLRELKPTCFEDIIAAIALYRPGPMAFIPDFIKGKHNPEEVEYICPEIEQILKPTYGVIVYQEQVMQIFQSLAGYTLGGADAVRKAISKKHTEEILAEKDAFVYGDEERGITGCIKKTGITEYEAIRLFDSMVDFGKYAFNKSHATAYAMVSLFTAYLKTYHTAYFYKETLKYLSPEKKKTQFGRYINEMSEFGIMMEAPSLLYSDNHFKVSNDGRHIYFGFADIKDMSAISIKVRTECLQDFVQSNPDISQSVLLTLAKLGCFKTIWKGDETPATIKQAKEWILANKPKYEKLSNLKRTILELKECIYNETDSKVRNSLIKKHSTKVAAYKSILSEIQNMYYESKAVPAVRETKFIQYQNEKELCFSILSAKNETKILQFSANDFSCLKDTDRPQNIAAIVVGISDVKKTKTTGKSFYNVDLMDKTGNIITRRFKEPPTILSGIYSLQPNDTWYFYSKAIKKIDVSNEKTKGQSFSQAMKDIVNGKLDPVSIKDSHFNNIGNGKMKLIIETSLNKNTLEEGENELCEEK